MEKRKVVLVSGSAKGIGKEIIRKFAKNNYDVVINYLTSKKEAEELKQEVESLGINCLCIKCDVSNEEKATEMVKEVEEKLGTIDILVNNAAIDIDDFVKNKKIDDFKKVLNTNVIAPFILSRLVSKNMLNNKWGRIINISSTNGINTYYPICLEYDASKAALISLTHNLAIEYAPYITVNAIAPGFIGTMVELEKMDEDFIKSEEEKILVKRMGKPEEVAALVYFLASDEAGFINNSVYRIDGGQYGAN